MIFYYLMSLVVTIGFLALCDYRYKLAFFHDAKRTAKTIAVSIIFFLVWDILGVQLNIFFPGNSLYDMPLRVLPGVPVEELFFLFLLSYITLLLWRGYAHLCTT